MCAVLSAAVCFPPSASHEGVWVFGMLGCACPGMIARNGFAAAVEEKLAHAKKRAVEKEMAAVFDKAEYFDPQTYHKTLEDHEQVGGVVRCETALARPWFCSERTKLSLPLCFLCPGHAY